MELLRAQMYQSKAEGQIIFTVCQISDNHYCLSLKSQYAHFLQVISANLHLDGFRHFLPKRPNSSICPQCHRPLDSATAVLFLLVLQCLIFEPSFLWISRLIMNSFIFAKQSLSIPSLQSQRALSTTFNLRQNAIDSTHQKKKNSFYFAVSLSSLHSICKRINSAQRRALRIWCISRLVTGLETRSFCLWNQSPSFPLFYCVLFFLNVHSFSLAWMCHFLRVWFIFVLLASDLQRLLISILCAVMINPSLLSCLFKISPCITYAQIWVTMSYTLGYALPKFRTPQRQKFRTSLSGPSIHMIRPLFDVRLNYQFWFLIASVHSKGIENWMSMVCDILLNRGLFCRIG